jgi:hypothetical protein
VDRFLTRKTPALGQPRPAEQGTDWNSPATPRSPGAPIAPQAPAVQVVPFVCEDDVRRAKTESRKIYINAKTIVTPAARDLDDGTVLVRTD